MKHFIIFSLIVICGFATLHAQDNLYDIDKKYYDIFLLSQKQKDEAHKLAIADSMFKLAQKDGDYKSQCVALIIPMRLYYSKKDKENLYSIVKQVQTLSKKSGNLLYYYYAWALKANYLKNKGSLLAASEEAEALKKQAAKDKFPYGIYTSIRMLGNIYETRGDYKMAIHQYQEALNYAEEHVKAQDISPIYRAIGWCNVCLNKNQEAIDYYEKGIQAAKGHEPRLACMMQKCFALYSMKRFVEYNKTYNQLIAEFNKKGVVQERYLPRLNVMHYCINNDFAKAWDESLKGKNKEDCMELQLIIYKAQKNFQKALEISEELTRLNDSIKTTIQEKYLTEMNAKIGNTTLEFKTQQLKLENANTRNKAWFMTILLIVIFGTIIVLLLLRNLKHSRIMNKELAEARDKAMGSDKMKTAFMQNISHEVRTPLNVINGFSQLLATEEMELTEEMRKDFSNRILDNSNDLIKLVNNMLDIADLETGEVKLGKNDVYVNSLCNNIIEILSVKNKPGVNLKFESNLKDDFSILSDEKRMTQIITNLISNSQKNTDSGEINLKCEEKDNRIWFYVEDTGCGIPQDKANGLFDMFNKTDYFKSGAGLGLTVSQLLVNKLGGKIGFDKERQNGACFWFYI